GYWLACDYGLCQPKRHEPMAVRDKGHLCSGTFPSSFWLQKVDRGWVEKRKRGGLKKMEQDCKYNLKMIILSQKLI
ncbi:MAG TPA: hypothetical protein VLK22_02005, partial [Candidatus Udaeobacter sp.]|nr:hypothetical protein [Candidatus Udaeobacter sp.]